MAQVAAELMAGDGRELIHVRQASYNDPREYIQARKKDAVTLREYLDELIESDQSGRDCRYVGNVALPPEYAVALGASPPQCVDACLLEPPAFWLGPRGSVTPRQKDSTGNFAMQIVGRKRWLLFALGGIPSLGMSRPSMDAEADFATSPWDREQVLESLQNR